MPKTITRELLSRINTGFKAAFQGAFDKAPSAWKEIAEPVKSTTKIETYAWLKALPKMRKWIGERFVKKLDRAAYTLTNEKFEATVEVEREDVEDDNIGTYAIAIKGMGEAAAEHPDELVFEALKGGFENACFDGQNFFDTDHPVMVDGQEVSVSNMQDGAGPAWFLLCTTKSVKPLIYQDRVKAELEIKDDPAKSDAVFDKDVYRYGTRSRGAAGYSFWQLAFGSKADLSPENFQAARTAMASLKDDEGRNLNIVPNVLVIPPALETKAEEILLTSRTTGGKDNPHKGKAKILMTGYLA